MSQALPIFPNFIDDHRSRFNSNPYLLSITVKPAFQIGRKIFCYKVVVIGIAKNWYHTIISGNDDKAFTIFVVEDEELRIAALWCYIHKSGITHLLFENFVAFYAHDVVFFPKVIGKLFCCGFVNGVA